jgi:WD40-like Beta Propeller Repeat
MADPEAHKSLIVPRPGRPSIGHPFPRSYRKPGQAPGGSLPRGGGDVRDDGGTSAAVGSSSGHYEPPEPADRGARHRASPAASPSAPATPVSEGACCDSRACTRRRRGRIGDTAFEGRKAGAPPITPGVLTNGVIAYATIGEEQVFWTVRPDGSDRTRVRVDVPGFIRIPSWSPNGTRIVFDVNSFDNPHTEAGTFDVYVANADGSHPVRLTSTNVDHSPVWSPDGSRIAYVHGLYGGRGDLGHEGRWFGRPSADRREGPEPVSFVVTGRNQDRVRLGRRFELGHLRDERRWVRSSAAHGPPLA